MMVEWIAEIVVKTEAILMLQAHLSIELMKKLI